MWGLVVVSLAACGGTDTSIRYADDDSTAGLDLVGNQDIKDPWGDGKPSWHDNYVPTGDRFELIPLHSPDHPVACEVGKKVSLQVRVFNLTTGVSAQDYPIAMMVVATNPGCTGEPVCGHLLASEAITGSTGIASITFDAKDREDVLYTIVVTGPEANDVQIQVEVGKRQRGDMHISFFPSNPDDLAATPTSMKVVYGKGYRSCANFNVVTPWNDGAGERTVAGLGAVTVFPDLLTSDVYWAYTIGYRMADGAQQLVVWGCTDMVHLMPVEQGPTPVTIQLSLVDYNPTGLYDMTNHIDFSEAIPGVAGQIVDTLEMIFYNPGYALLEGIKFLVSLYISPAITDLAFGLFQDALGNYITNFIFNSAPPELLVFFEAGQDLLQVVNNLELYGELKLSKATNKHSIQGIENWFGIRLHWAWFCGSNPPPGCGTWEFGLDDLGNSDFPLDLVAGQFTAQISGLDDLYIQTHEIKINYGMLILFVINDLILPAVTNYNSLSDLLYSIVDCANLAASLSSGILTGIGISQQDLENFCLQAEAMLLGPVEAMIGGLSFPSNITLSGHCKMRDDNNDLYVDRLTKGIWTGQLTTFNSESGVPEVKPISGDFEATRK
jgi:hypothetical protein